MPFLSKVVHLLISSLVNALFVTNSERFFFLFVKVPVEKTYLFLPIPENVTFSVVAIPVFSSFFLNFSFNIFLIHSYVFIHDALL